MTDEQIKQNAEEYASTKEMHSPRSQDVELDKLMIIEDYIAGAHSRDEEIEELKEEIESLQEQYNTCFDGFKKRGTKLGELMKENVKLRNPWISVEERLPKALTKVFVRRQDDFYLLAELNGNKWFAYGFGWQDKKGFEITHWMPIPELEGGDV